MSDTPSPQTPAGDRLRRWLGPALLISLIINLFLVGMMATAMIAHRPGKHMDFRSPPPSFFGMIKRGAADLPPGDRAAMRDIMLQQFPIIRPYFIKIDTARRELAGVIATNPYDPVRVAAAFAKVDTAQAEMVKATRDAMIEGFGKMSNEQRARLADAMRKQADRRLKGPGADNAGAPPPGGPDAVGLDGPPPPGSPDGPPPQ
ncbi:MAG TPA: periplasmic heavy metal sensor [Parvibaculum sp.]